MKRVGMNTWPAVKTSVNSWDHPTFEISLRFFNFQGFGDHGVSLTCVDWLSFFSSGILRRKFWRSWCHCYWCPAWRAVCARRSGLTDAHMGSKTKHQKTQTCSKTKSQDEDPTNKRNIKKLWPLPNCPHSHWLQLHPVSRAAMVFSRCSGLEK